jgi:hypothetical protein
MHLSPHTLSLITTYRCTAACDHCCFSCSPREQRSVPARQMRQYIEQAREFDSIRVVVFTGGECFLLGRDLDELVKAAADAGFVTRFVSNGYWATSREAARKRLERLRRGGLTEANFSTGEQHGRFVPPEYVRHGAIAAAEMGLTSLVVVDSFGTSRFDFEAFVSDPEFSRRVEDGSIIMKVSPWIRFGGERRISYTKRCLRELNLQRLEGCVSVLKVVGITPKDEVILCCGLAVEQIPEMKAGTLRGRTIKEVVAEAPDDFMKIWISLQGPDAVVRYARSLDPTIALPRQVGHPCEVCRFVYGNPRVRALIRQQPPKNMPQILSQYVQSLVLHPAFAEPQANFRRTHATLSQVREIHRGTLLRPAAGPSPERCRQPLVAQAA